MKGGEPILSTKEWHGQLACPCALMLVYCLTFGCATGPTAERPASGAPSLQRSTQGAPWTILCLELEGPHRRLHIEQVAATLSQTQGIRADAVSVVHDPDGRSRLYYGVYFRRADRKTGKLPVDANLRQDFELIQQLGDGAGARYFLKARLVRQPQPDVGDPQWSLTRAEGLYSLQVAAFEPTDDFWEYKQAAAEYCAWLRKKEYPAYYHHGPACSIVTVGTFGATAVVPSANGLPRYGPEVVRMQEDPLLMYNLVNGAIVKARVSESSDVARFNALAQSGQSAKDSKKLAVPSYSRLVPIPGRAQEAHP